MTFTMAALFPPFKESRKPGKLSLTRILTCCPYTPPKYESIRHGRYSGAVTRHARNYSAVGVGVFHRVFSVAQSGFPSPERIYNYTRCSAAEKDAARFRGTY